MKIEWKDYLDYRNGRLYWKARLGRTSCVKLGSEAGCDSNTGYRVVIIKGKGIMTHRLVWEMHFGPIPEGFNIDHINRDKLDNRIENLRLLTPAANKLNKSKYKSNNSGLTGVHWRGCTSRWLVQGKGKHLGSFDNLLDAAACRMSFQLNNNFTYSHGKGVYYEQ